MSLASARRRFIAVRHGWRGAHEVMLFAGAYVVYFGVRALTQGDIPVAVAHARDLFHLERALGIDWETAVHDLALGSPTVRSIANAIYIWGHWPVLIIGGVLLFNLSRRHYYRLRNVCLLSGAIGLAIFALFPVAPPRLSGLGFVDTITQHAPTYRAVFPSTIVNEYAAMPSFHAGWDLMLGIALFGATTHLLARVFAVAMPLAMGFATVATANHFVADVFAGAAIVTAAVLIVRRYEPRPTLPKDGTATAGPRAEVARRPVHRRPPRGQRPGSASPRGAPAGTAHRG
jgi:hypothetical protein